MNDIWQSLLVLGIVGAAALYLTVQGVRWLRRKQAGGCGSGCSRCPASEKPLVTLQPPPSKQR